MSTRARIGIETAPGEVTSIYSHWDGYVEAPGVGWLLSEHWQDPAKVQELIIRGDVSSLGREIGEHHDFDSHHSSEHGPDGDGWTLFYGRDRGEQDVGALAHPIDAWPDYSQNYEYLMRDGVWYWHETYPRRGEWRKLSETHLGLKLVKP